MAHKRAHAATIDEAKKDTPPVLQSRPAKRIKQDEDDPHVHNVEERPITLSDINQSPVFVFKFQGKPCEPHPQTFTVRSDDTSSSLTARIALHLHLTHTRLIFPRRNNKPVEDDTVLLEWFATAKQVPVMILGNTDKQQADLKQEVEKSNAIQVEQDRQWRANQLVEERIEQYKRRHHHIFDAPLSVQFAHGTQYSADHWRHWGRRLFEGATDELDMIYRICGLGANTYDPLNRLHIQPYRIAIISNRVSTMEWLWNGPHRHCEPEDHGNTVMADCVYYDRPELLTWYLDKQRNNKLGFATTHLVNAKFQEYCITAATVGAWRILAILLSAHEGYSNLFVWPRMEVTERMLHGAVESGVWDCVEWCIQWSPHITVQLHENAFADPIRKLRWEEHPAERVAFIAALLERQVDIAWRLATRLDLRTIGGDLLTSLIRMNTLGTVDAVRALLRWKPPQTLSSMMDVDNERPLVTLTLAHIDLAIETRQLELTDVLSTMFAPPSQLLQHWVQRYTHPTTEDINKQRIMLFYMMKQRRLQMACSRHVEAEVLAACVRMPTTLGHLIAEFTYGPWDETQGRNNEERYHALFELPRSTSALSASSTSEEDDEQTDDDNEAMHEERIVVWSAPIEPWLCFSAVLRPFACGCDTQCYPWTSGLPLASCSCVCHELSPVDVTIPKKPPGTEAVSLLGGRSIPFVLPGQVKPPTTF